MFYACVDARNRALMEGTNYLFIKAKLNLTFIFPQRRRRDRDNCLARFKPGLDAIVQAGLLLDDDAEHLQIGKVDILVDPARAPLTIIELEDEMKKLGVVNNEGKYPLKTGSISYPIGGILPPRLYHKEVTYELVFGLVQNPRSMGYHHGYYSDCNFGEDNSTLGQITPKITSPYIQIAQSGVGNA